MLKIPDGDKAFQRPACSHGGQIAHMIMLAGRMPCALLFGVLNSDRLGEGLRWIAFRIWRSTVKVLMVLTSHDQLGDTGRKTGFWLEELAAPYYVFKDAGAEIVLASPKGGRPPLDPKSNEPAFQTEQTRRFESDAQAMAQLAVTVPLDNVSQSDFDTVFYPGGHGPLWDIAENKHSIALIEAFLAAGKPVALVCHAPGALRHARASNGNALVEGKKVTGFTNSEEAAVELSDIVPFLVEDELKAKGGIFSRGGDWAPYVVSDGLLITGQNPASSAPAAERLLKKVQGSA